MNQKTKIGASLVTGILPCWYLGFRSAQFIQSLTSRTEMIGNRKMLFYMHPALMLALSVVITLGLLYGWHQIFGRLWDPILEGLKNLKNIQFSQPDGSSVKTALSSFFTFGQWTSEKIVKIIFYFGLALVFFQLLNLVQFAVFGLGFNAFNSLSFDISYNFPVKSALFGLLILVVLVIELILWKCVCEVILIVLRAFEAYYIKTVCPEKLKTYTGAHQGTNSHNDSFYENA